MTRANVWQDVLRMKGCNEQSQAGYLLYVQNDQTLKEIMDDPKLEP